MGFEEVESSAAISPVEGVTEQRMGQRGQPMGGIGLMTFTPW